MELGGGIGQMFQFRQSFAIGKFCQKPPDAGQVVLVLQQFNPRIFYVAPSFFFQSRVGFGYTFQIWQPPGVGKCFQECAHGGHCRNFLKGCPVDVLKFCPNVFFQRWSRLCYFHQLVHAPAVGKIIDKPDDVLLRWVLPDFFQLLVFQFFQRLFHLVLALAVGVGSQVFSADFQRGDHFRPAAKSLLAVGAVRELVDVVGVCLWGVFHIFCPIPIGDLGLKKCDVADGGNGRGSQKAACLAHR